MLSRSRWLPSTSRGSCGGHGGGHRDAGSGQRGAAQGERGGAAAGRAVLRRGVPPLVGDPAAGVGRPGALGSGRRPLGLGLLRAEEGRVHGSHLGREEGVHAEQQGLQR